MKIRNMFFFFGGMIFFISNIQTAQCCCWSWGGDDYSDQLIEGERAVTTRTIQKKISDQRPIFKLDHTPVKVTSSPDYMITDSHLILPASRGIGAIIGTDDRKTVAKTTDVQWRPHGHLEMSFPDDNYIGSGTLVHPHHVVTAGHCVFDKNNGWAKTMTFTPGQNGASRPFGTANVTHVFITEEWYKHQTPEWDIALLVLDSDIGKETGWYGIMAPTDNCLQKLPINVTGYPRDRGGNKMCTMSGNVESIYTNQFTYTIDTNGGESGGSAWTKLRSGSYCCGVHTYGQENVINTATRITEAKLVKLVEWMNIH
jgi:glutamyl endopeptidase